MPDPSVVAGVGGFRRAAHRGARRAVHPCGTRAAQKFPKKVGEGRFETFRIPPIQIRPKRSRFVDARDHFLHAFDEKSRFFGIFEVSGTPGGLPEDP